MPKNNLYTIKLFSGDGSVVAEHRDVPEDMFEVLSPTGLMILAPGEKRKKKKSATKTRTILLGTITVELQ